MVYFALLKLRVRYVSLRDSPIRTNADASQAVSYGINSASDGDVRIPFFVNCAVMVLTIPCMVFLIKLVAGSGKEEENVVGGGPKEVDDVDMGAKRVD